MYAYGAEKSIAAIPTQKDHQREEYRISFHIQTMHQHHKKVFIH